MMSGSGFYERDFGRLEGKIDELLRQGERTYEKLEEHDDRLNTVENKQAYEAGKNTIISSIAAFFVSIGATLVGKHW